MTTWRHDMPFGAMPIEGGGVAFRLWAPSVPQVMLRIEGDETAEFPMIRYEDGWHRRDIVTPGTAGPGTRYRFLLPDGLLVPDPASRRNPDDVHAASQVVDPAAFDWPAAEADWRGRPWREAVIYELHVGTFSPTGDFAGVEAKLDHLVDLGVTALEMMPVADFPGRRNWGYDGVLPFAPEAGYGTPEDFKRLVAAAHARGLMVFLDVVYNHFGPDGNYLHAWCPEFFDRTQHTPWGAAIDFRRREVRDFFIHNARYWLEEFRLDGLRLDAIHAIRDESAPDIVEEIRNAVAELAEAQNRYLHLILENDRNQAHYLDPEKSRRRQDGTGHARRPPGGAQNLPSREGGAGGGRANAVAQWNDDIHHALHVIATGETDGYYADYAGDPHGHLIRCLTEGFAWQGEPSPFRGGEARGEPSAHLPPGAFINFLQTHDQIGNRAFGERLGHLAPAAAVEAATALLLLAPQPPLLFMGEEFAAATPFLYFCDFAGDLARAVTEGRRREFAAFARFADPGARERIPDPNAAATFEASRLDWASLSQPGPAACHARVRHLLAVRRRELVPRLGDAPLPVQVLRLGDRPDRRRGMRLIWTLADGSLLTLTANLSGDPLADVLPAWGRQLASTLATLPMDAEPGDTLPPWTVCWHLREAFLP